MMVFAEGSTHPAYCGRAASQIGDRMIDIEFHTAGTTRLTLCIGGYAVKLPRGTRGCVANYGERIEWERATPARRDIMCPLLWSAPFGLVKS